MATLYPLQIELKIHITDGEQVGTVSWGCPPHELPVEDDIPAILEKVMQALPEGFRLMTRQESVMYWLREEKGYRGPNLAMPPLEEGATWHDPDAAEGYSDLGSEPDPDEEE